MTDTDFFKLSPIKREKLKKEQRQLQKQTLRANLPILTPPDIRKYRLPRHEALIIDLTELGLHRSSTNLRELIDFQDTMRKQHGPGTPTWLRPELIHSNKDLDVLFQSLSKAETAHNSGDFITEWNEMLELIVRYAFGVDDWWWLGEQLFMLSAFLNCDDKYRKYKATSYYIFGKYLLQNDPVSATYYLEQSRNLSEEEGWNAKKFFSDEQDTIYMESCSLLYEALYQQAELIMETDLVKAAEFCTVARKMAAEACKYKGEFHSLILKGKCELLLKDTTAAIVVFNRALKIAIRQKWIWGICEARIQLALGYLEHGKSTDALDNLQDLKQFAETEGLPYYVAQAYRYLGEYHLNLKEASVATPLLTSAYYQFQESGHLDVRENVRILAAISAGEELYSEYAKLIQSCDNTDQGKENLPKLVGWKDSRQPFWNKLKEEDDNSD